MNLLEWGLLVLVLWPIVQVPGLFYLSRRVELDEGTQPISHLPGDSAPTASVSGRARSPTETICVACGSHNDRAFSYCRDCLARL